MAYVSHSSFDYRSLRERVEHVSPSLLFRSAAVAVVVAAAMLLMIEGRSDTNSVTTGAVAAKADRLAPASVSAEEMSRMVVDQAARTTTVERGVLAALSPDSPMAAQSR